MRDFLSTLPEIGRRVLRGLLAVACMVYSEGWQALLERLRARTDSEKLTVEQRRVEIANKVIDLVVKVEKIKDPRVRERARAAVASIGRAPPTTEVRVSVPGSAEAGSRQVLTVISERSPDRARR